MTNLSPVPPRPQAAHQDRAFAHRHRPPSLLLSTNSVSPEIEQQSDGEEHLAGKIAALKPFGDLELVLTHRIALTLAPIASSVSSTTPSSAPGTT